MNIKNLSLLDKYFYPILSLSMNIHKDIRI